MWNRIQWNSKGDVLRLSVPDKKLISLAYMKFREGENVKVISDDYTTGLITLAKMNNVSIVEKSFKNLISDITEPLRKNDINIVEIISSQTAIVLFVDWKDGEKARDLINEVLK